MKPKPKVKKPFPKSIEGSTRLAALIEGKFNVSCSKQSIRNWQKKVPPFPASKNNRFNVAECFSWMETHIVNPKSDANISDVNAQGALFKAELEAKSRISIAKAEREIFELDELKGKYIERDIAANTTIGALRKYHGFVRTELELNLPAERREKLTALGASVEIIGAFYEFDLKLARGTVDRIEARCAKEEKDDE